MNKPEVKIEYEDGVPQVTITDGVQTFTWNDSANIHCPEDLCWSRMISDVFWKAYEMGYYAALN